MKRLRALAVVAALAAVGVVVRAEGAVTGGDAAPARGALTRVCACAGSAYGFDLNDRGDVVWTQPDGPQFRLGFVWRNGRKTQLGRGEATVNDLNDRGQVVGWSDLAHGGYVWERGRFTPLAPLRTNTIPSAINERGQIVGSVERQSPSYSQHAFLWEDGKLRDLGTLPGTKRSTAGAIDERGRVAGVSDGKGFLWEDGRMTAIRRPGPDSYVEALTAGGVLWVGPDDAAALGRAGKLIDLTRLGGKRSAPAAINARGQVVGWFRDARWRTHAFLWQDGRLRDLGTLGGARSEATALNDRGEVVGRSETRDGTWTAFLWRGGTMRAVGDFRPLALNDRGQILATRGNDAVLWTPR